MTNKSKIEQLFTAQKKAVRAIMPGYINYYYKDGVTPTHTKAFFNEHNILTVQSIIYKNASIFMNKVENFPNQLPRPVLDTIDRNFLSTRNGDQPTYQSEWYQTYNTPYYRMSTFFKSPLLYTNLQCNNDWITYNNPNIFKSNIKFHLLIDAQSPGAKRRMDTSKLSTVPNNWPKKFS